MITDFATSEAENTMSSQASQSDSGSGSGHQTGFTREKPCIAGGGGGRWSFFKFPQKPVISRVNYITWFIGVKKPQLPMYKAIYKDYNSIYN